MPVVDKADDLGFYTTDSQTKVEVKAELPSPGALPVSDDLFILRASFLGSSNNQTIYAASEKSIICEYIYKFFSAFHKQLCLKFCQSNYL